MLQILVYLFFSVSLTRRSQASTSRHYSTLKICVKLAAFSSLSFSFSPLSLFHLSSCFQNIFSFTSLSFCLASPRKHERFFYWRDVSGLFFIFSFQTFRNWRNGHSLVLHICWNRAQVAIVRAVLFDVADKSAKFPS